MCLLYKACWWEIWWQSICSLFAWIWRTGRSSSRVSINPGPITDCIHRLAILFHIIQKLNGTKSGESFIIMVCENNCKCIKSVFQNCKRLREVQICCGSCYCTLTWLRGGPCACCSTLDAVAVTAGVQHICSIASVACIRHCICIQRPCAAW